MRPATRLAVSDFALRGALRASFCAAFIFGAAACAQQQPVLYPNTHYEAVGPAAAAADVDSCMQLADAYVGKTGPAEQTAKSAGAGGAVGSAVGGAAGAVRGHAGRGAAAGAAGGAAGGLVRGILRGRKNDPLFQRYVERCLRDRGFETIGWR
jgi:hypothetical protein